MSWIASYQKMVPDFLKSVPLFLGEDVKFWMLERGLPPPDHENAWGAAFNMYLAKSGFIIRTGKTRKAVSPQSKGHEFRLWKSMLCEDEGQIITLKSELSAIRSDFITRKITIDEALRRAAEVGASSIS